MPNYGRGFAFPWRLFRCSNRDHHGHLLNIDKRVDALFQFRSTGISRTWQRSETRVGRNVAKLERALPRCEERFRRRAAHPLAIANTTYHNYLDELFPKSGHWHINTPDAPFRFHGICCQRTFLRSLHRVQIKRSSNKRAENHHRSCVRRKKQCGCHVHRNRDRRLRGALLQHTQSNDTLLFAQRHEEAIHETCTKN